MTTETKCPVMNGTHRHTAAGAQSNRDWWPNQLNLQMLHQNSPQNRAQRAYVPAQRMVFGGLIGSGGELSETSLLVGRCPQRFRFIRHHKTGVQNRINETTHPWGRKPWEWLELWPCYLGTSKRYPMPRSVFRYCGWRGSASIFSRRRRMYTSIERGVTNGVSFQTASRSWSRVKTRPR